MPTWLAHADKRLLPVFSVTPFKIDQNENENRSIDKVQNHVFHVFIDNLSKYNNLKQYFFALKLHIKAKAVNSQQSCSVLLHRLSIPVSTLCHLLPGSSSASRGGKAYFFCMVLRSFHKTLPTFVKGALLSSHACCTFKDKVKN